MNSSSASKVSERHSVLVLNIGTFAEEDEAYELLNNLSVSLPLVVIVTCILDALLAGVYLKWLHPWKILLQEVSSPFFDVFLLKPLPLRSPTGGRLRRRTTQGQSRPTRWYFIFHLEPVLIYLAANPGGPYKGCHSFCHFSWTGGEKKRSTLTSNISHQKSPLLGERVAVEVELHSGVSFHQVDVHILMILSNWAVKHLRAFSGEPRASCDPGEPGV